jgi:hypothetical protein
LTVFAIWLPMLAGDSRSAWDGHVLDDPRVVSLWDGERVAGRWFGDHSLGGVGRPGDVVWDAYFAFRAGSRWPTTPTGLVAAGSDIIDNTEGLHDRFAAALAGP